MSFREAVESTPDLQDTWHSGLQALRKSDKQRVVAENPRRLSGSVDVDTALKSKYPNDPRWDYAIGHADAVVYWVEVHPASDGQIKGVLAKLQWLIEWLREQAAKTLNAIRKEFIWISSGKTSFTLTSPQQKRLALAGLQHTGRVFKIPDKAAP